MKNILITLLLSAALVCSPGCIGLIVTAVVIKKKREANRAKVEAEKGQAAPLETAPPIDSTPKPNAVETVSADTPKSEIKPDEKPTNGGFRATKTWVDK
jgi:hypothetical protein